MVRPVPEVVTRPTQPIVLDSQIRDRLGWSDTEPLPTLEIQAAQDLICGPESIYRQCWRPWDFEAKIFGWPENGEVQLPRPVRNVGSVTYDGDAVPHTVYNHGVIGFTPPDDYKPDTPLLLEWSSGLNNPAWDATNIPDGVIPPKVALATLMTIEHYVNGESSQPMFNRSLQFLLAPFNQEGMVFYA